MKILRELLIKCCNQVEMFHVNSLVIPFLIFSNNWYTWKKQQHLHSNLEFEIVILIFIGDHRGHDRMVDGFTNIYAKSVPIDTNFVSSNPAW